MKKLSQKAYQEISEWIHRNARPLDLALWQYHFENGTKDAVFSALIYYQNSDGGFCELLEDIEGAGLMDYFDYVYLEGKMHCLVRDKICNDTKNFMANPLEFVLSPNSRFYEENKYEVEVALDFIIDQRPALGVWNIPWEWYNGDKYPKAFAISENWWKSFKAIEKLLQLKSFGRLANWF